MLQIEYKKSSVAAMKLLLKKWHPIIWKAHSHNTLSQFLFNYKMYKISATLNKVCKKMLIWENISQF